MIAATPPVAVVAPASVAVAGGGQAYIDYSVSAHTQSLTVVESFPSTPGPQTFFQAFDGHIGGVEQYFGLQTDPTDGGSVAVVWSRFSAAGVAYAGNDNTKMIQSTELGAAYTSLVDRAVTAPTAKSWYVFTLTHTGNMFKLQVNGRLVGVMHFPGTTISNGGSWVEYWPQNGVAARMPVPESHVSFVMFGAKVIGRIAAQPGASVVLDTVNVGNPS
jgi:hypothetical protein